MAQAPTISEDDPESLARYLSGFEWDFQDRQFQAGLVEGGLPLWREILRFTPNPAKRGLSLELGSPPFNISLLMRKLRNYDLELTGFASDGRTEILHERQNPEFAEQHTFRCRCFDAERERFPYDDNTFDHLIWSEVIEHLTQNPVHTLSEIHRVLKPGGTVVISTPNVCRADNIARMLRGNNIYDPYHLGSPFAGSRHSREYTFEELHDLVEGCGYKIDRIEDIDIFPPENWRSGLFRALVQRGVRLLTRRHYGAHLFVRARKTSQPFRWHFPPSVYAANHLAMYLRPRDARVVIGENDAIHLANGWDASYVGPAGQIARRAKPGVADAYLLGGDGVRQLRLAMSGGAGTIQVMHDNNVDNLVLLAVREFAAPGGTWSDVVILLNADYQSGNPLHVRIESTAGVDLHSITAE